MVDGPIAKVLSVVRVPLFVDGPGLAPVELKLREDAPGKVVEHEENFVRTLVPTGECGEAIVEQVW